MEFGILFEGQVADTSAAGEREVLRGAVEQAVLAEQVGFDRFYCVEHHGLEGYSHSSAPEVLLSFIAAKTSRIRIAHGVIPLPFKINHPVRVAERTAMLDLLSNGRLDVGFGRSSSSLEQETFGVTPEESKIHLVEGMKAVATMWTEEVASYSSEHLTIPPRKIRPRPLQDPHPPMFMACTRDDTFELAGRMGVGAMSNAADGPPSVRRKRAIYDAAVAARKPGDLVGKFANDRLGASVFSCVLDDRDEARRVGLRGMRFFMEASRHFFAQGSFPDPTSWHDEENEEALRKMLDVTAQGGSFSKLATEGGSAQGVGLGNAALNADAVLDSRSSAMGTAKDTIDFVERMADAGADECYFIVGMGGVPQAAVIETIRQIGENVIPHFRKPAATVIA